MAMCSNQLNDSSRETRFVVSRRVVALLLLLGAGFFVGVRAVCELSMIEEHGNDPQLSIWYMFTMAKLTIWSAGGLLAIGLVVALWRKRLGYWAGIAMVTIWVLAISITSWNYWQGRQALADAANLSSHPDRLRELVQFDGIKAGYELDNRLALNRNTPPDALRLLAQRRDQTGTLIALSRNPNTPSDVLQQLQPAQP